MWGALSTDSATDLHGIALSPQALPQTLPQTLPQKEWVPKEMVQDLRESRIDPMAPVMVSPSPWQRITALINELPGKTRVA